MGELFFFAVKIPLGAHSFIMKYLNNNNNRKEIKINKVGRLNFCPVPDLKKNEKEKEIHYFYSSVKNTS